MSARIHSIYLERGETEGKNEQRREKGATLFKGQFLFKKGMFWEQLAKLMNFNISLVFNLFGFYFTWDLNPLNSPFQFTFSLVWLFVRQ